jgi:hypothetical protein
MKPETKLRREIKEHIYNIEEKATLQDILSYIQYLEEGGQELVTDGRRR